MYVVAYFVGGFIKQISNKFCGGAVHSPSRKWLDFGARRSAASLVDSLLYITIYQMACRTSLGGDLRSPLLYGNQCAFFQFEKSKGRLMGCEKIRNDAQS